jgi:succinoglycan biosynthesis protein ExoL
LFFAHNVAESTVGKRARAFTAAGLSVTTAAFRRYTANREFVPEWPNIPLGITRDRAYLRRLALMLAAYFRLFRHRDQIRAADIFYARNFDMCLLAIAARVLAGRRIPIVYEVLDVHRLMTADHALGRLARWGERRLLRRIDLLVLSSPAFMTEFFARRQGYAGRWFLLENKVVFTVQSALPERASLPTEPPPPAPATWVVGWFGALRDRRSLALLCQIAEDLGERVQIYIRGYPAGVSRGDLDEVTRTHPNVVYEGEFKNPDDLPAIYARVHFTWAIDFFEAGFNSTWLLPNRLYEGALYGSLALAADGTQTAEKVRLLGLGWTFPPALREEIGAFLRNVSVEQYEAARRRVLALPLSEFVDMDDSRHLAEEMTVLAGRKNQSG